VLNECFQSELGARLRSPSKTMAELSISIRATHRHEATTAIPSAKTIPSRNSLSPPQQERTITHVSDAAALGKLEPKPSQGHGRPLFYSTAFPPTQPFSLLGPSPRPRPPVKLPVHKSIISPRLRRPQPTTQRRCRRRRRRSCFAGGLYCCSHEPSTPFPASPAHIFFSLASDTGALSLSFSLSLSRPRARTFTSHAPTLPRFRS
jgi:hypothetical protein